MIKIPTTCSRFYGLKEKCPEAITYAEKNGKSHKFNYNQEIETHLAAEERYDFACEHLRKRIEASGIELPEKYKNCKSKYLQLESNVSIGQHFKELKAIHSNRKRIKKGEKILLKSGAVIDRPLIDESKIKSKGIQKILYSLYESGITWDCPENSDNWLILTEPMSRKRVKIQIDTRGYGTNSIYIEELAGTLRLLVKKWNEPFDPKNLNEGTLTDCGWHAYLPDEERRATLNKAISIHGRDHILRALKMSKISPWLSDYEKVLEKDIGYASKGRRNLTRFKRYDRLIYVMLI